MSTHDRDLSELGAIWRSQPPAPEAWTRDEIVARVKAGARRHDRAIFWRNAREIAAGALLAGVMGWSSWLAPGRLPKAAAAAGAASVVFVLAKLVRSRRANPPVREDLAIVDRLQAEVRKVEAEIRLLGSVRSWYLAPLFAGTAVWSGTLISVGLASAPISRARLAAALAACAAITALVFWLAGWVVWKLNRTAVRTHLEPYAAELRALLNEIRSETEDDNK